MQGVFVLIDKQQSRDLYDFPHKRFREVLAAKYLIEYGYTFLFENIEKEHLSELWIVIFQISKNQEELLVELFESTKILQNSKYKGKLIYNCLKQVSSSFPAQKYLKNFIVSCINSNSSFQLPAELFEISNFTFDDEFSEFIREKFYESIKKTELTSLSICCYLISKYNRTLYYELIVNVLCPMLDKEEDFIIQLILGYPFIGRYIREHCRNSSFTANFLYIFLDIYPELKKVPESKLFAEDEKANFCYVITDEIIETISKKLSDSDSNSREDTSKERKDLIYFLASLRNKIFFDSNFLNKMPPYKKVGLQQEILGLSKIDYKSYKMIMEKIVYFNKHTAEKITIFREIGKELSFHT